MSFHFRIGTSWSGNLTRNSAIADLMAGDSLSSSSLACAVECSSPIGLRRARDLLDGVVDVTDVLRIEQHRAALAHLERRRQRPFGVAELRQADEVVLADRLYVFDLGGVVRRVVVVRLDRLARRDDARAVERLVQDLEGILRRDLVLLVRKLAEERPRAVV